MGPGPGDRPDRRRSREFPGFASGAVLLGVGTAMVYPTLLAAIGDVAHPSWRASAVGVYRLWRDLGYAVGALLAGATADLVGLRPAIGVVAAITFVSGVLVAIRLRETRVPAQGAENRAGCLAPDELGASARRGRDDRSR